MNNNGTNILTEMTMDELNQKKLYWFNRWNFETGDIKDRNEYDRIVKYLEFLKEWDFSSVTNVESMFNNCSVLTSIDLSSIIVPNTLLGN